MMVTGKAITGTRHASWSMRRCWHPHHSIPTLVISMTPLTRWLLASGACATHMAPSGSLLRSWMNSTSGRWKVSLLTPCICINKQQIIIVRVRAWKNKEEERKYITSIIFIIVMKSLHSCWLMYGKRQNGLLIVICVCWNFARTEMRV